MFSLLLELFLTFFKIGLFTFGGGYAMIPMIQDEVIAKGWLTHAELINFIAISESTPGTFAINIATFIGSTKAGILGAIFTTLGVILPSFIIIILVAKIFLNFQNNKHVKNTLAGIKAITSGLIATVVISLFVTNISNETIVIPYLIILAILVIIKLFYKKVHPILLIVISAILGIIIVPLI
ncbi:MAG: chromate transporter [Bacilli bacterium]|nr:chromate transporter [Bacilli bacterium]